MDDLDATKIAAWWGAGVATAVLCWDFYKWKVSGARIRLSVSPNMITVGMGEPDGKKYILVTVDNMGDRPTTITHLLGTVYSSWYRRFRGKQEHSFFVPTPSFAPALPYVLRPGERWSGTAAQTEEFKTWSRDSLMYLGVAHTARKKSELKRVIILPEDDGKEEPPT
jgi:hypothetical protein